MAEDKEPNITFNNDQKQMFDQSEDNQTGTPIRSRMPSAIESPEPDIGVDPKESGTDSASEEEDADPWPTIGAVRGPGGTDITGGVN